MFLYQATNTKAAPYGISVQDKIVILQERLNALEKGYAEGKEFYPVIRDDINRMTNAVNSKGGYNVIYAKYANLLEKRILVSLSYLEESSGAKTEADQNKIADKYKDRLYAYDGEIAKIEKKISGSGEGFVEEKKQGKQGDANKTVDLEEEYRKELDALIRMAETYNMLHPQAKIKIPSIPADATEEQLLQEINKLRAALGLGAKSGAKKGGKTEKSDLDQKLKLYPVSVDDVWADTKAAYERNNAGLSVDELTAAKANNQFVKIIDYEVTAGRISAEQRDMLMKGELPAGEEFTKELALLKAMLRISTQRGGMAYVKASFDAYSGQTTDQVLLALPKIATEMTYNGKKVGAKAAGFWAREFNGILAKHGVKKEELNPDSKAKLEAGESTKDEEFEAFKNDWRTVIYNDALPGGKLSDAELDEAGCTAEGAYSADLLGQKAKAAVESGAEVLEPRPELAEAQMNLALLLDVNSLNLKQTMIDTGVLVESGTRKALRDAELGGGIVKSGGKFYALSNEFVVNKELRGEIAGKMAEGNLDMNVLPTIQLAVIRNLVQLGMADSKGALVFGNENLDRMYNEYLNGNLSNYPALKSALSDEAAKRVEGVRLDRATIGALMFNEPEVKTAFEQKCGGESGKIDTEEKNSAALAVYNAIKDDNSLKDENGNFVKKRVIDAISGHEQTAQIIEQPAEAEVKQEKGMTEGQVQQPREEQILIIDNDAVEAGAGAKTSEETAVTISTGTWADAYLNEDVPERYKTLSPEQQTEVQDVLKSMINDPYSILQQNAHDAKMALEAAINVVLE